MTYALVRNGTIEYVGALPSVWNDGTREWDMLDPQTDLDALGWFPVVITPAPTDTPTSTWRSTIVLVGGVPTQTWYEYIWTAQELAEKQARTNELALRANPQAQIDAMLAAIAAIQAMASMTNAEINANPAAAMKAMGREFLTIARRVVRIARLQLDALESTNVGE